MSITVLKILNSNRVGKSWELLEKKLGSTLISKDATEMVS